MEFFIFANESNVFEKLRKIRLTSLLAFLISLIIYLIVSIRRVVDQPFLNPFWFCLKISLTYLEVLLSNSELLTGTAVGVSVIPW